MPPSVGASSSPDRKERHFFQGTGSARRNRGIALVVVLWILALLALIATLFIKDVRTDASLARNLLEQTEAQALAEAGLALAVAGLSTQYERGGLRADGTVYEYKLGAGQLRFAIYDEGGKIDLNAAPSELIAAHLAGAGGLSEPESVALADAIVDFRDPDDLRRLQGAEAADYRAEGSLYRPKNLPFETVDELGAVLGMTEELFRAVVDGFTVHSGQRRPQWVVAVPSLRAWLPESLKPDSSTEPEHSPALPVTVLALGPTPRRSGLRVYGVHAEGLSDGGGRFAIDSTIRIPKNGGAHQVLEWAIARSVLFPTGSPSEDAGDTAADAQRP